MPEFKQRQVGKTSLKVTELGLGTATMAGIFADMPAQQARDTVGAALDSGINFYDTAPQYGHGRSEHLVGDGLRGRRAGTVLSSKVGRLLKPYRGSETTRGAWVNPFPFDQVHDYSYDGVMRSYEDSLQRLGLADIDILLVHDIGVMTHGKELNDVYWKQLADGGYRALTELKAQGLVKAIGLGVNEWEVLMDAFGIGDWDVFLLAGRYTLLEQTSLDPFLTTCVARGASIICGGPFNGGALMGTGKWNYGSAPQHIIDRVAALEALCKEFNTPLGAVALQFPLAHQAVCNVLPGPKSPAELDGIIGWWNTPVPDALWDALADRKLVAPGTPLPNGRVAS